MYLGSIHRPQTDCLKLVDNVHKIVNEDLVKTRTGSFNERMSTDLNSLRIVSDTYGFGAGFGSTRSSSLLTNILGNTGVLGFAALLWFLLVVIRAIRQVMQFKHLPDNEKLLINAFSFFCAGSLFVGIIAVPDFNSLFLWNAFSILAGLLIYTQLLCDKQKNELEI
jgi:hypothetical protein